MSLMYGRRLIGHTDPISLIEDAQRSKAASWAYFAGDEEQAVKILMSSESE